MLEAILVGIIDAVLLRKTMQFCSGVDTYPQELRKRASRAIEGAAVTIDAMGWPNNDRDPPPRRDPGRRRRRLLTADGRGRGDARGPWRLCAGEISFGSRPASPRGNSAAGRMITEKGQFVSSKVPSCFCCAFRAADWCASACEFHGSTPGRFAASTRCRHYRRRARPDSRTGNVSEGQ